MAFNGVVGYLAVGLKSKNPAAEHNGMNDAPVIMGVNDPYADANDPNVFGSPVVGTGVKGVPHSRHRFRVSTLVRHRSCRRLRERDDGHELSQLHGFHHDEVVPHGGRLRRAHESLRAAELRRRKTR